ncbi:hypothetical protein PVAND_014931 [Polypedilum vanderplanki]|uniref:Uncharacterized protein n=1 Tax=Polypedilum vanderplanki TaxID=319348 RepID=A0A9J6BBF5_POLVA|nr:hypothetical protein PVAND_014931 [Polypedilum vanderplanki]
MKINNEILSLSILENNAIYAVVGIFIILIAIIIKCAFGKCSNGDDQNKDITNNGIYSVYKRTTLPGKNNQDRNSNHEHQPLKTVELENLSKVFDDNLNQSKNVNQNEDSSSVVL